MTPTPPLKNLRALDLVSSPVLGLSAHPDFLIDCAVGNTCHLLHRLALVLQRGAIATNRLDYGGILGRDDDDSYDYPDADGIIVEAPYEQPRAVTELFTPAQILALMRFNSQEQERTDYYGHYTHGLIQGIQRNLYQLYTLDVSDLLGERDVQSLGLPRHLVFLNYRGTPNVIYCAPSNHSMWELPAFIDEAHQAEDFVLQHYAAQQRTQIRPILAYDSLESDYNLIVAGSAAGYDVLARFAPDSQLGHCALKFAQDQHLASGAPSPYMQRRYNYRCLELPPTQCPTVPTATGPQSLHTLIFVPETFFAQSQLPDLSSWAIILGTTADFDCDTAWDTFFTRSAQRYRLKQLFAADFMQACRGHEAETLLGAVLTLDMATTSSDEMPLILRFAGKLRANRVF